MSRTPDKNQTVIRELERIKRANHGLLEPKTVVEEARSESSPLHPYFEWDDSVAAENFRIWQARHIIAVVTLDFPDENEQIINVRAYHSLPSDRKNGGGYRSIVEIVKNDDHRAELLESMLEDIRVFRERYRLVKEAVTILEAMLETEQSVKNKKRVTLLSLAAD